MDENTVKLAIEILIVIGALVGGSFTIKKIITNRKTTTKQKNITISGNDSKVVGGDDYSSNEK